MTCEPIDRLVQSLRVEAPGAPDGTIQLQLFNAMDFFFRRTSAWQHRNEIELAQDVLEYDFSIPADSEVVRLMAIEHNGVPVMSSQQLAQIVPSLSTILPDLTFPDGDRAYSPDATDLNESGIFSYAIYKPSTITVTPGPGAEQVKYPLKSVMALTVARGCLESDCGDWALPDWMYDMFFEELLAGTLSRLFMMPAKPWSSPTLAVTHGRRFRDRMAYRKQEALKGFTYGVPTWRFPKGGW